MADVVSIEDYKPAGAFVEPRAGDDPQVVFDRHELDLILQVYGRKVVAGDWRDYALTFDAHCASFAVIGGAAWAPDFVIVKWQDKGRKGGAFSVLARGGRVLRWGRELAGVLRLFEDEPLSA